MDYLFLIVWMHYFLTTCALIELLHLVSYLLNVDVEKHKDVDTFFIWTQYTFMGRRKASTFDKKGKVKILSCDFHLTLIYHPIYFYWNSPTFGITIIIIIILVLLLQPEVWHLLCKGMHGYIRCTKACSLKENDSILRGHIFIDIVSMITMVLYPIEFMNSMYYRNGTYNY